MDNITKVIDSLRIPHLFRDVLLFAGGVTSLMCLKIITTINLVELFRVAGLSQFENTIILLILAYAWGKILLFIFDAFYYFIASIFALFSFCFLDNLPIKLRVTQWFKRLKNVNNFKNTVRAFLRFNPDFQPVYPNDVKNQVGILEIYEAQSRHPSISAERERHVYHLFSLRIAFSTLLILTFLNFHEIYLFILLLLFSMFVLEDNQIRKQQNELFRAVVKESFSDRNKK